MTIPVKPFPTYKWRWLSFMPNEGLLKAPVFLGVLRALQRHEGEPYSSVELYDELIRVKADTGTIIDLARTPERNLFRNSGQYWRGTGLVSHVRGEIQLTNLGRNVAAGRVTNDEFAALMVRNTILPNPQTYSPIEMRKWRDVDLRIKPLELILALMDRLGRDFGISNAFLSPNELVRVVIPLAGERTGVSETARAVHEFRTGRLDVSRWPDCAPKSNDKRLAREFLLFLENFGICQTDETAERYEQKFYLDMVLSDELQPDVRLSFLEDEEIVEDEVSISQNSEIPLIIERKRVATSVLRRTNQARFHKDVLAASAGRCLLTQETTQEVLEAAHILPVGYGGTDLVGNGFCLRVDIHRLFDAGKIRVKPSGKVELHERISEAVSYEGLPNSVILPAAVTLGNVEWRERYL